MFAKAKAALDLEAAASATGGQLRQAMADMMPLYFRRYDGRAQRYSAAVADDIPNADAMHLWGTEVFRHSTCERTAAYDRNSYARYRGRGRLRHGPACAREVTALVRRAELVSLPECGHMLWIEQREAFVAAVTRFLLG